MPLHSRGRVMYGPVASADEEETSSSSRTGTATRANEGNTNSSGDRHSDAQMNANENQPLKSNRRGEASPDEKQGDVADNMSLKSDDDDEEGEVEGGITVVILDPAQKRFHVQASSQWTVSKFKRVAAKVHKVSPPQQRLIFRGKLLEDKNTMEASGINADDVIVHLFPKPRVIMANSDRTGETSDASGDNGDDEGAHVPQIVLDPNEQARTGQILVLGSSEVIEAQSNVRMLSLLLFVVSLMRLLALFSIATGTAQVYVDEDDIVPGGGSVGDDSIANHTDTGDGSYEVREWARGDWFDLVTHVICFIVAGLGCRATNQNTSVLAKWHFLGTLMAGITWNVWNLWQYITFVEEETGPSDDDKMMPLNNDDLITVALFTLLLPLFVWLSCCMRALQFRNLIREAEQEAADRIQSQLALVEGNGEEPGNEEDDNENNDSSFDSDEQEQLSPAARSLV